MMLFVANREEYMRLRLIGLQPMILDLLWLIAVEEFVISLVLDHSLA